MFPERGACVSGVWLLGAVALAGCDRGPLEGVRAKDITRMEAQLVNRPDHGPPIGPLYSPIGLP